jgi:LmbE family N-acetylglucosaminyl deacetylase
VRPFSAAPKYLPKSFGKKACCTFANLKTPSADTVAKGRRINIVHALQNKNKLNQRMDIPGNIYSGIESANALDCAENGVEGEANIAVLIVKCVHYTCGVIMKHNFLICLSILLIWVAPTLAQDVGNTPNAAEIRLALEKLNVLGTVLYVGAHPDDENTGIIAYWAKEKKYRAAYLSITRGDGGQNLIGAEKGSDIGILRSQELLAARRIDGGEQFFTRAIDFGFSKSVKESFEFWGHGKILADTVWVIRNFRPDVIVLRFSTEDGTGGGHGHHPAASILAVEAFSAAADASRFPEQLKYVKPWQAKRILLNQPRFGGVPVPTGLPSVDIGVYNPLLGQSYNEIAGLSRSMHKSQGFGSIPSSGSQMEHFRFISGEPMAADIMEGVDTSWKRVPGGEAVGQMIEAILASYNINFPAAVLPQLLELNEKMAELGDDQWIKTKRGELIKIIQSCAGLRFEALAEDYAAAPGESINIAANLIHRTGIQASLNSIYFPSLNQRSEINQDAPNNAKQSIRHSVTLPFDYPNSQPYWLIQPEEIGSFNVADQKLIGLADNPPALSAEAEMTLFGKKIAFTAPVRYRWLERDKGEMQRPFEVRPPVTANFKQKVAVFYAGEEKRITITLNSHASTSKGTVSLKVPAGWRIFPEKVSFEFTKRHDEKTATFSVRPPIGAKIADIRAVVTIDGKEYSYSLIEIEYPHIDTQVHFPDAALRLIPLETKAKGRLGYIMGSGDEIPEILKDMGYDVVLLDDDMLTAETLNGFDAIVAGIRAYNTRERLKFAQPLLMDFVKNGGKYIVQYNVNTGLHTTEMGPYSFSIGRSRIVEEDADMRFLVTQHPILNMPNAITRDDFNGWVQERGLYFAEQWDQRYTPIFAGHDTGERDLQGGTLYGEYGKGVFIYTSLAFFRQLPAGVPGAFRLFQNMLAAGKP